MRRSSLLLTLCASLLALLLAVGCTTLDERQRAWIFQPSDDSWGGSASMARGMDDVWIDFRAKSEGEGPARLHGLWLPAAGGDRAPVVLYLHGARWNVQSAAPRMLRLRELGFAVLAIDYRGFGKSSAALPSEASAQEDARAAWDWLRRTHPARARYIYGHSLGGAIAIDLAAQVDDERGTLVEATFSSIPDVASTMKWGWLPVGPLITQRFDSMRKVGTIGSPLVVIHGDEDRWIDITLARRLYAAAKGPKRFVEVGGGSHHSALAAGLPQVREAMAQLFADPGLAHRS